MKGIGKPATPMMRRVAQRWSAELDRKAMAPYDKSKPGHRKMPETVFKSMAEARDWFQRLRELYVLSGGEKPKDPSRIPVHELVDYLITYAHFTVFENGSVRALYMYDYDSGLYIDPRLGNKIDILIAAIRRQADTQYRSKVCDTLMARSDELMLYNPLPSHKIALGNGVYNLITGELEDFSPVWTTFGKIDTAYKPEAVELDRDIFGDVNFGNICDEFANHNPERVRLLEEICKAVVVGNCRQEATFFVVGEGGDGKSTFFAKMLGNTIGDSNIATLSLPDINDDNKVRLCESKKMILGTDNPDNYFMSDNTRFKMFTTHDRIAINVKYQDARSLYVSGMMVQLLNTFPNFPANAAMARRIVPLRAENRYVSSGTADESISSVVTNKRFSEHVLASILALPYRRNFSDCDMDLLDESMAINDTLGQFIEALVSFGALDEEVLALPTNHLYAAYLDWLEENAPRDSAVKSKTFTNRIRSHLEAFGFKYSNKAVRPNSGTFSRRYKPSCFHEMCEGEHLRAIIDKGAPSHTFEREKGVDPATVLTPRTIERADTDCSVFEYLNIEMELYSYMSEEERRIYNREAAELAESGKLAAEPPAAEKVAAAEAAALPNVAAAYRSGDRAALARVRSWLSAVADGAGVGDADAESTFGKLEMQLARAMSALNDPALSDLVDNMGSAGTYPRRAQVGIQVVDALMDALEGGDAR